ncbi:MAG: amidase [Isosphaeraceae bacterium]
MNTSLTLYPPPNETILGVSRSLREGQLTCASILEHCFQQIDRWDDRVHAWVVVDRAGAMKQARDLDRELKEGRDRGPLHGIPVGIKDIIDVAGLPTAAGFRPWERRVAENDAAVVAALRAAGAVILGKTVTTQFAWVDPPVTLNPWNPGRTPGGSSSGSAVAVATGMCLAAIGSQTGGSIIRPASFCGIVGYKPPFRILNTQGVLPFAPHLDHLGPLARTVTDVRLVMQEILAHQSVPGSAAGPASEVRSEAAPRLVRLRGFFDRRADMPMYEAYEDTLEQLSRAGASIVELPDDDIDFENILFQHRQIMASEAAAVHEARYAESREHYATHIKALIEEGARIPASHYARALLAWRDLEHAPVQPDVRTTPLPGVDPRGIDAVVSPAAVGPAPDPTTTGNPCFNAPWSYFGWPAATIPMRLAPDGLPLGLQIAAAGPVASDVLGVARWCENVLRSGNGPGGA